MATLISSPQEKVESTEMLTVETTRFGRMEVEAKRTILLPEGIIGFRDCTRFAVYAPNAESPFKWLQSMDNGSVAFPIVDPWQFFTDYSPTVSDSDANCLGIKNAANSLVFVIVTIPRNDPQKLTANLLGPILINSVTCVGKQIIVQSDQYTTKHSIVEALRAKDLKNSAKPADNKTMVAAAA